MTFVINFKQLVTETKQRADMVRKVTKLKDKLQSGADSIQFFLNVMHDIREQINLMLQMDMEEELEEVTRRAEQTNRKVEEHDQMFIAFKRFLSNNLTDGTEGRNLDSINFSESLN